jgi:cellulose synthase operon protein C
MINSFMMMRRRAVGVLVVALLAGAPARGWSQDEPAEASDDAAVAAEAAEAGGEAGETSESPKAAPEVATAPSAPKDASPELLKELEAFQKTYAGYERETRDYQLTVDGIVDAKYRQKIANINQAYEQSIRASSEMERLQREQAIAAFERFLARYPRHPRYTPDALFRLAELYFEKSNDDFLLADESYQEEMEAYEKGLDPDRPPDPVRDYGKTMATFERLIAEWPDYRLVDGAYYLLAYCQLQTGNYEEARGLFAKLIEKKPDSRFVPEAWIRIGEFYFESNDLDAARAAYAESMKFPESRFYDKALYKLAWTYYRQDRFDEAIKLFKQLIEYSDAQELKTGKSGSVLRAEAVQYMAVSLAETDWDLDGITDAEFGLVRAQRYLKGEKPYEREVLAQLIQYMFDAERWTEVAQIARYTLQRYPYDAANPQLHEQLILAMYRSEQTNDAFAERRNLGTYYGPESEWYAFQEKQGNVDAMQYSQGLVKDNLIQSATWFHEQAQKKRNEAIARQDESMLTASRENYSLAARSYADFLKKYPNDKDAFQWSYYLAECLYFSEQYMPAFEQYQTVRETDLKEKDFAKVQEQSAFSVVKSLEKQIARMVADKQLPAKALPPEVGGSEEEPAAPEPKEPNEAAPEEIVKIEPEPIPEIMMRYVTALDRYVVLQFTNKEDPETTQKFAFQAAKVFYDFRHLPEARKRFDWIITNYADKEIGYLAGSLMIESYRLEKDYAGMSAAATRLKQVIPPDKLKGIEEELRTIELGGIFKDAEKAMAEKRYEEAAQKYIELVQRDPKSKVAALALNNAAVAYEAIRKYDAATKLYERVYNDFPKDPLASYALYRVAVNSERFFEFDKAVQNYLAFYDRFATKTTPPELKQLDFDYGEKGADALRNAGVLLENMQKYPEAAKRYEEFAKKYPSHKDAGSTQWQAGQAWKKAGKDKEMIRAVETFIKTFGTSENSPKVLEGSMLLADHYEEKRDKKSALRWYDRTLSEYASRRVEPGSPASQYAAKAQFMLAEEEFKKWDAIQIKGALAKQKKALGQKQADFPKVSQEYDKVYAYRSLEWVMAAGFRKANLFQRFAQTLYDASVPFREGSEEYDIYRQQLDEVALPLEDKAVEEYAKIAQKAREEKIVNEWTKRTLEELNKYRPAEYPLYKEERVFVEERPMSGLPTLGAQEYETLKNPPLRETEEKK